MTDEERAELVTELSDAAASYGHLPLANLLRRAAVAIDVDRLQLDRIEMHTRELAETLAEFRPLLERFTNNPAARLLGGGRKG